MNKLITILLSILLCISCGTTTQIPIETIINYKDSTIVNVVDSVRYIPKERIVDVVAVYDSLTLETNMAKAKAWVDTTTHTLKGSLENKQGIIYKYKYIDRVEVKDSIVTKEVPVEIIKEKIVRKNPWYFPILLLFSICGFLYVLPYIKKFVLWIIKLI